MNKRLDTAVETARQTLSEADQDVLAEVVERFLEQRTVDPEDLLTPEQLADLDRRLASDEQPADMDSVRAIFRSHGLEPGF